MEFESKENCPDTVPPSNVVDDISIVTETRKRSHSDDETDVKKSKIDVVDAKSEDEASNSLETLEIISSQETDRLTPTQRPRRSCLGKAPFSLKTPEHLNEKKAQRELERLRKTEEQIRAKEERERQLEQKRIEKELREKEREEKRKELELKKEEKRKEEERKKEEKRKEEERKKEEKRKEEEKKKEEKRKELEERMREKEEKRKEEEERKRKREEEKEAKRREEEDRRKKKEEEKEKKRKEEEEKSSKKREEDERKEAKRREEEAAKLAEEEKKRRMSSKFMSFFKVEKKASEKPIEKETWFLPFNLKEGASLAPILRRNPLPSDWPLPNCEDSPLSTYLKDIQKVRNRIPASQTGPLKAKLFHFHLNYRPPYYGTWRKRSKHPVTGRTPFGKMEELDYENDSDLEWEEEPEDADECRSDEEEEDKDEEEDDDEGFFVEPGYLSDGEGEEEQEDCEKRNGEKEEAEVRAERLAARAKVWEQSVNRKKQLLLATVLGPCYKAPPPPWD